MKLKPPRLSPADRRELAADLIARRLLELASKAVLLDAVQDNPAPKPTNPKASQPQTAEESHGSR